MGIKLHKWRAHFTWEITVDGDPDPAMIQRIQEIHHRMLETFPDPEEPTPEPRRRRDRPYNPHVAPR